MPVRNEGQTSDYGWDSTETCSHDYLFPAISGILSREALSKEALLLDAGCGGGAMVAALFKEGYHNIYGFDLSESGISMARQAFAKIAERFAVHNSYESSLPDAFPHGNYDLIISTEVIEHMYRPDKYIENLEGWLKPGGILIITTPYHGFLKNLAIALTNKFDGHMTALWEGGHIKFFSKKTLFQLLKKNGFQPFDFQGCGRMPYLWKSMLVVAKKI